MKKPTLPCYAVIFSSLRSSQNDGYEEMAQRMVSLARQQPGFISLESARGEDGFGITVSYWDSLDAISNWKDETDHLAAQELGKKSWYLHYDVRIARVERSYESSHADHHSPTDADDGS